MSSAQLYRNQQPDPQQMYNGFSMRSQPKDRSSPSLGVGSSNRPTSAGAVRSNRNNQFYAQQPQTSNASSQSSARNNTGTTNIFTGQNNAPPGVSAAGLMGQGYTNQRPSSAGHSRPQQSGGSGGGTSGHLNVGNPGALAHLLGSHQYPPSAAGNHIPINLTGGGIVNGPTPVQSSSGRPKSASSVRRTNEPNIQQQQNQQNMINMQNIYGVNVGNMTAQQMYNMQQQQQLQYKQQQQQLAEQQQLHLHQQQQLQQQQAQQYHYGNPSSAAPTQRPLSANATSHTSAHNQANQGGGGGYADHWSNQYKMHYNYQATATGVTNTGITNKPVTGPPQTTVNNLQYSSAPTQESSARPSSASAVSNKLRTAVDLSHKYENAGTAAVSAQTPAVIQSGVPMVQLAGLDNDDDDGDMNLDTLGALGTEAINQRQVAAQANGNNRIPLRDENDDDEMDGKPIYDMSATRSHPEVSLAIASASLELNGQSSAGLSNIALDVRNTSLDSFSEDHIVIGLSTVPNQFCTKRDALELKKLLILSSGTRGGIVPSSSAVMDMYMVGKVVGVGSYGKVRAAWHRLTSSKVAIKTYDKSKLKDPAHWKRVHSEIKIMEQISHPRIARMYEAVETPKRMHLIMECLDGGNLCSYVKAKRRLSEDESRRIFFQILQAIEHLHALGVSHRDVKLENVLFEDDKNIKLIDFGFSTVCQPGKKLKVFCGTPSYMAPEIVRRAEYEGKPVDIWSLGILLYALLCGCFPFRAKAYPDLYRRIARGTFPIPDELSAPVKDLLRQLLTVDPETRVTAHAAMRHSWLQVQLINAPNIDKLRQETTILISDKPADDLDDQVISELEKFGMTKEEVIRLVLTKTHSSLATLYYLLLDTLVTRRKHANKRNVAMGGGASNNVITGPNQSGIHLNNTSGSGGGQQRPKSASATSSSGHNMSGGGGGLALNAAGGQGILKVAPQLINYTQGPITTIQQQQQAQLELQQQQALNEQQQIDRQEYRYRPKSAAMNRSGSGTAQRPSSAFATRR